MLISSTYSRKFPFLYLNGWKPCCVSSTMMVVNDCIRERDIGMSVDAVEVDYIRRWRCLEVLVIECKCLQVLWYVCCGCPQVLWCVCNVMSLMWADLQIVPENWNQAFYAPPIITTGGERWKWIILLLHWLANRNAASVEGITIPPLSVVSRWNTNATNAASLVIRPTSVGAITHQRESLEKGKNAQTLHKRMRMPKWVM